MYIKPAGLWAWLRERLPSLFQANLLAPPTAPQALPNIPDGEPNLLPTTALSRPLRIEVPIWPNSNPMPGFPETLTLYWQGAAVGEPKRWEGEIPEDDLFVEAPVALLLHGTWQVTYEVYGFNGVITHSEPLTLTIDTVPPVLGGDEGLLLFDEEVERDGVTARYLEKHEDCLLAELPAYQKPAIEDVILYYWDDRPFANDKLGEYTVAQEDTGQPILLSIEGDDIRSRGDGERYVHYQVRDRAGNLSARSRPVPLQVAAAPVPRFLPWLEMPQAAGSGEALSLQLNGYQPPMVVIVPEEAVIYPDEWVTVVWGAPGDAGYFTTSEVMPGTDNRFLIPEKNLLAYSNQALKVSYEVSDGIDTFPSTPRNLKVAALSEKLPQIVLVGATSDGFSLGGAPANVPVKLDPWRFIAVGQRINIWVTGVLKSRADSEPHHVLQAHAVTEAQVRRGIGADNEVTVLKTFLATLKRDEPFTLHVQVSFNNGANWVDFPQYHPMLRA
ncbi:hypothetical protein ACI2KG_21000 [Pseudomonas sp. NPDC089407]|uniref:hypothetical protein n=1 Tax=Pseudomonas sp. NPDC089407 TaxID=3364464 RepID=UPI00384D7F2C